MTRWTWRLRIERALAGFGLGLMLATGTLPLSVMARERVEILAPHNPGSAPDILARVVADGLIAEGFQAVVRNVPGAAGELAVRQLLRGSAETVTLMLAPSSIIAINPHLYPQRSERELWRHAPPVAFIGRSAANYLVVSDRRIASVGQLIAQKRQAGAPVRYGSSGVGSFPHLMFEEIFSRHGPVDRLHVPYKSANEAIQGLLGGDVDVVISGTTALPLITSGRIHPIAVTGETAPPPLAAVTPLARDYPGLSFTPWFVLFANRQATPLQLQGIRQALRAHLGSSIHRERLQAAGIELESMSEAKLLEEMQREFDFFKAMVDRLKIERVQ